MRKLFTLTALALVAGLAFLAIGTRSTFAYQRDFRLHNASYVPIVHIYVSPSDTDAWENDVLDGDVLFPGQYTNISFGRYADPGECIFDIRVDGIDGEQGFLWGVNLCQVTDVTFH